MTGGWLRPTVFGAVDGLVTSAPLIASVGVGGVSAHAVVLTGVAALSAITTRLTWASMRARRQGEVRP